MSYKRPPPLIWHAVSISDIVARMCDHEDEDNDYSTALEDRFRSLKADYANAKTTANRDSLKKQLDDVEAERTFSNELTKILHREVGRCKNGTGELGLELAHTLDPDDKRNYFTKKSVYYWARKPPYKKEIAEWARGTAASGSEIATSTEDGLSDNPASGAMWNDVRIRILAEDRISYSIADSDWKIKLLSDVGLIDGRSNTPNKQFIVLLGIAADRTFGSGQKVSRPDKACKNKLCKALKQLTAVDGDPFLGRSTNEGYMPRFSVNDHRNDASKRIERSSTHVQYKDEYHQHADDHLGADDEDTH
ncbi:MAG: hypothetical protein V7742_14070 [Halioglobus sp.]